MKIKFYYQIKNGHFWDAAFCDVIDSEKYDENYSNYLAEAVWEMRYIRHVDYELDGIERVEKGEIECFETGTDIFDILIYKDRVEFEPTLDDEEWQDWSCSLEEYKKVLLGKKAFLMLPHEVESYLEMKINDL